MLPQAKLEREIAKSFPQMAVPTKVRYRSESRARLEVDLPVQTLEKLKRVREILSQKRKTHINEAGALEFLLDEFIERHDPLEKAKRAAQRAKAEGQAKDHIEVESDPSAVVVVPPSQPEQKLASAAMEKLHGVRRTAFDAATKHHVGLRDQGQCAHHYPDGTRCGARQWLHIHHLKEVAHGGSNDLGNLITLCRGHHALGHQRHLRF